MLFSNYENEIFDRFCLIDFSILSVSFSHVCIIYVKIYEKMSSGGLEVSLSTNSVDPDEILQNAASHQGLRCLPR